MDMVKQAANEPEMTPKPITKHEIVEEGTEDRISTLPDCLLLEILSRLQSTKAAIKTGILSKRWKPLWTSVSSLSFSLDHSLRDLVSSVNKTLTQCRQLKLKKFRVWSHYESQFKSDFNDWIRYAVSRNVEELRITLLSLTLGVEFLLDEFFFINRCVTDLKLSGCILNPIGAISWENLRSLSIAHGNLNEVLIENILSGSPQLEILELVVCYGFSRLDITSKSVKNLVVFGYMDPDGEYRIVEINAPNILSLGIQGDMMVSNVLLLNVSSLVKANIDYDSCWYDLPYDEDEEKMLEGFMLNLRHVKELKIGRFCSKVLSRLGAKAFIRPSNLKFLDDATSPS